jgi:riboflavin kinase/FMN adenylyltransferase
MIGMIGRADVAPLADGPLALAVSDFDGTHIGHLALARRGAEMAEDAGARLVALLPWPSPGGGDNAVTQRLTTLEERIARLRALGLFAEIVVTPAPDAPGDASVALDGLSALGDVRALVCEAEPVGAARALLPPETAAAAVDAGLVAEALAFPAPASWDGLDGSRNSLGAWIGALVESGRMAEATAALGYPYTVSGDVIGGDRRGRLLGFPTANLRPDPSKIIPANGVYAALVGLPGEDTPAHPAAVSVGVRPTFGEGNRRQIEAYLLDASLDLYGLWIEVQFVAHLRPELRFDSVEALIHQMDHDCEQTRRLLGVK